MNHPYKISSLILILTLLFVAGCKEDNNTDPVDKLQLGLLLPLTGSASSTGQSVSAVIDIALNDLREYLITTEKNLEVELLIRDTGTNPDTALQKLKELHAAGIKYVIGPYTSTNAEAVLSFANDNGMIILSPSSVATTLAISGDNLYRLLPSDRAQAEAISALFMYDSIKVVIPIVRNDVWGTGLLSDADSILSAQGINMENAIMYDPASLNASEIATQVSAAIVLARSHTPDSAIAVYLLSFAEGTEILHAVSLAQNDPPVKWYGSSAFANNNSLLLDDIASDFARAQRFRSPSFAPDSANVSKWGPVNDELISTLGRKPEVFALTTYDAIWVMAGAYLLAHDHNDLRQFKSSLEDFTGYFDGITGKLTLDNNGDRKYASFNFWGIASSGGNDIWKSFGSYNNADGQLIIY